MRKHPDLKLQYPNICKSKSSKQNKKHLCPIEDCECGYLRKADLKSHFMAKHRDYIHLYPTLRPPREKSPGVTCQFCSEEVESGDAFILHIAENHGTSVSEPIRTTEDMIIEEKSNRQTAELQFIREEPNFNTFQKPPMVITEPVRSSDNHKMKISFLLN